MTLKDTLLADMKSAMKEKDSVKLETVRLLRAAIQRKEVDDQVSLDDEGVLQIVQKMVKQCGDAARQFEEGGRDDLAKKEKSNISILECYLPDQLSQQELSDLVQQAIEDSGAESMKDMGKVMGLIKSRAQGRADMAQVSAKIKALLS